MTIPKTKFHLQKTCPDNSKNAIHRKRSIFFLLFPLLLLFFVTVSYKSANAQSNAPVFKNVVSSLAVGKSTTLTIKNLPKKGYARFYSSNGQAASVQKRTGKLKALKAGNTTITAKIYNKNKKKTTTLKTEITIYEEYQYLPNVHFSVEENINPWNYTITLKASRILLKNEINMSILSLVPEGKTSPDLTAAFSSLSEDGKEITYLFNSSSQKKLCPHDGSMNGNYKIRSNSFSETMTTNYTERLGKEDISGFVLDSTGVPIANTFISYKTSAEAMTTNTDETGHYLVKASGTPLSLTARKEGYRTETLTSLHTSDAGTICENIILKTDTEDKLSFDFCIMDEEKNPISEAAIYLLAKDAVSSGGAETAEKEFLPSDILFSGRTDQKGVLSISDHAVKNVTCSKILLQHDYELSFLSSYTSPAPSQEPFPAKLVPDEEYTLYFCKNDADGSVSYQPSVLTFSPSSFFTDHFYFEIFLEKKELLNTSNVSVRWEASDFGEILETLTFSFFKSNEKKAFYKSLQTLEKNAEKNHSDPGTFSVQTIPVSLADGTYYLRITGQNKAGKTIISSPVSRITIENSSISPITIFLQKNAYCRLLAYYSGENLSSLSISLDIYQKTEGHYFFMKTVTSAAFAKSLSDLFTADLSISSLLAGQTYLFLSHDEKLHLSSYIICDITADNLYQKEEDALSSPPFLQCPCTCSISSTNQMPEGFSQEKIRINSKTNISITKEMVRSASSYPNTVIAMYEKNGTFISTSLLPKLDKNTAFAQNTSAIIDIYTNKELMITNQEAYRL